MKIYQTEGLLLKTFPLAESDKILACLTRDFGAVRMVARGARKLKSKFSGRLEPFTIVSLDYRHKEDAELAILQNIELKHSFFHLAGRLDVVSTFGYFSELLSEFTPANEPNEKLYRLAVSTFSAVEESVEGEEALSLAVLYFELWLLRLTGFLPDLNSCGNCRKHLRSENFISWSPDNRFLCQACGSPKGVNLNAVQIGVLRRVQRFSPEKFIQRIELANEDYFVLRQITRKLIKQVLLRDLEYWSEKNWVTVG